MSKTIHSDELRPYQPITVDGGEIPDQLRMVNFRVTHRRDRIQGQWTEYRVRNLVVRGEYLAAASLVSIPFNELLRTTNLGTVRSRVVRPDGQMDEIYYRGPWRIADLDCQVADSRMVVTLSLVSDESDALRDVQYAAGDPEDEGEEVAV